MMLVWRLKERVLVSMPIKKVIQLLGICLPVRPQQFPGTTKLYHSKTYTVFAVLRSGLLQVQGLSGSTCTADLLSCLHPSDLRRTSLEASGRNCSSHLPRSTEGEENPTSTFSPWILSQKVWLNRSKFPRLKQSTILTMSGKNRNKVILVKWVPWLIPNEPLLKQRMDVC